MAFPRGMRRPMAGPGVLREVLPTPAVRPPPSGPRHAPSIDLPIGTPEWVAAAVQKLLDELHSLHVPERVRRSFFFGLPAPSISWFRHAGRADISALAVGNEARIPLFGAALTPTDAKVPATRVFVITEARFFAQKAIGVPVTEIVDFRDRELLGFLSFRLVFSGTPVNVRVRNTALHTDATTIEVGRFGVLNRMVGPEDLPFAVYASENQLVEALVTVDKAFPSASMTPNFGGAEVAGFSIDKPDIERLLGE